MSKYYCSEHEDNADPRCSTCEAALEWERKDERIATQQARIKELVEAAQEVHRISNRDHEAWHRLAALLEDSNDE